VVFGPPPLGNDPTMNYFDEWLDCYLPKAYSKYEYNPFKIVIWRLLKSNSGCIVADRAKTKASPTPSKYTINDVIINL
jgi:hypothetical protein